MSLPFQPTKKLCTSGLHVIILYLHVSNHGKNPRRVCVGDICALLCWKSSIVSCNDHMNPIWIDTVYFGMLPILDATLSLPPPKSPAPLSLYVPPPHTSQPPIPRLLKSHLHCCAKLKMGRGGREVES